MSMRSVVAGPIQADQVPNFFKKEKIVFQNRYPYFILVVPLSLKLPTLKLRSHLLTKALMP